MSQITSLDPLIRTPSGHQHEWDTPSGRKNSELWPPNARHWLLCGVMHGALLDFHFPSSDMCRHWPETDACLSTCGHCQLPGRHTSCSFCSLLWSQLPLCVCVTCMWLYWLIGEVSCDKPGTVERHKHVWVTPFAYTPLLTTRGAATF